MMRDQGGLGVLLFDFHHLGRVERQFGGGAYHGLWAQVQPILSEVMAQVRTSDILVRDERDTDLFLLFLSSRRHGKPTFVAGDIRKLCDRLEEFVTPRVARLMLPYFRDLKDNLMRFDEAATGLADQLLLCFDLYLNKSASEANEGIKVLTALTAISLPPIMIGTWFGMNFEHMPELASPLGYPLALGAMIVSTAIMFIWCKRRGWL